MPSVVGVLTILLEGSEEQAAAF